MTPDEIALHREQLALDRQVRLAEQRLAELRFEFEKQQATRRVRDFLLTPTGVVLLVAAIGLVGTAAGKIADVYIEGAKAEAAIVLKASDVPPGRSGQEQAKQRAFNLLWFVQIGAISLPEDTLADLRRLTGTTAGQSVPPPVIQTSGLVPVSAFPLATRLEGAPLAPEQSQYANALIEQSEPKTALTQNQRDALVSFIVNVGPSGFLATQIPRLLKEGKYDEIPKALKEWRPLASLPPPLRDALVRRRSEEAETFSRQ